MIHSGTNSPPGEIELNIFYCSNISNEIGHKLYQHYKRPLPTIYNNSIIHGKTQKNKY
jgi:hypothetical protein